MRTARVMVVDDSAVIRRLISDTLCKHPQIEVVAQAANGQLALEALATTTVDVIVLDIEMPVLDGVSTVRALRRAGFRMPVIMFSTLTERGARITFDALTAGATDYVTKPAHSRSIGESRRNVQEQLVPRVLALSGVAPFAAPGSPSEPLRSKSTANTTAPGAAPDRAASSSAQRPVPEGSSQQGSSPQRVQPDRAQPLLSDPSAAAPSVPSASALSASSTSSAPSVTRSQRVIPQTPPMARRSAPPRGPSAPTRSRFKVLVIGTSTGGPEALGKVLPRLPANLDVPVLIVQHMPPIFTKLLAERLDRTCALSVREAEGGELLTPGTIYIAPGDFHLLIEMVGGNAYTALGRGEPENFCRPAVDVLFRSAISAFGGGVLAVVLTGMGTDGRLGARALAAAGGEIIVQDEPSSVVWGMPGSVANEGLASEILDIGQVAAAVTRQLSGVPSRSIAAKSVTPAAAVSKSPSGSITTAGRITH